MNPEIYDACPQCGADRGEPCTNRSGIPYADYWHAKRPLRPPVCIVPSVTETDVRRMVEQGVFDEWWMNLGQNLRTLAKARAS